MLKSIVISCFIPVSYARCMHRKYVPNTGYQSMALSGNISSDVGASNADAVDSQGRSAQSYIDETPFWKEGTPTASASLTGMQWTIWFLAASAKFSKV